MFEILSIGDSKYLADVLNALAMITATDTFFAMCKIAIMVGVIGVVFSSLMNGGRSIDYHHILVAYIIWACMFVPKVDVQIEDKYTSVVYKVDNVPLGPAAAGRFVSAIGSSLTDLFEVAYSPIIPSMSTTSFLESLQVLTNAREISSNSMLFTALDKDASNNLSVRATIVDYIKNCTLKKIDMGISNYETIRTQSYEDAIKFITPVFTTQIYSTTGTKTEVGCDVAWNNHLSKDVKIDVTTVAQMGALFGFSTSNLKAGETAKDKLDAALNTLTGSSISADTYMKTVLYESLYAEATQVRLHEGLQGATAVAVNQAIQQRNSDWAGGHSLFMTTIRPMIAFFEAFIYAITPIMAFSILLGALGIKLALKYFMLILWVQLWYPLLSIINLYIYSAAIREFGVFGSVSTFNWDSFYAISSSNSVAENWIATGALLATSTPAIALFLVTGSAVAFTSLSSKLAGNDYYNEKQSSPDLISSKPVLEANSAYSGNKATSEIHRTGAIPDSTSISAGTANARSASVSNTATQLSSQNLSDSISNVNDSGTQGVLSKLQSQSLRDSISANGSKEAQTTMSNIDQLATKAGLTNSESDSLVSSIASQVRADGSVDIAQALSAFGATGKGAAILSKLGATVGADPAAKAKSLQMANAEKLSEHIKGGGSVDTFTPLKTTTQQQDGIFGLKAALSLASTDTKEDKSGSTNSGSIESGKSDTVNFGSSVGASLNTGLASDIVNSSSLNEQASRGNSQAQSVIKAASRVISAAKAKSEASTSTNSTSSTASYKPFELANANGPANQVLKEADSNMRSHGYENWLNEKANFYGTPAGGAVGRETARNMAVVAALTNPSSVPGLETNPELLSQNVVSLQKMFAAMTNSNNMPTGTGETVSMSPLQPQGPAADTSNAATEAGDKAAVKAANVTGPKTDPLPPPAMTHDTGAINARDADNKGKVTSANTNQDSELHQSQAALDNGAIVLRESAGHKQAEEPLASTFMRNITGNGNDDVSAAQNAIMNNRFLEAARDPDPSKLAAFFEETKQNNEGLADTLSGGPNGSTGAKAGAWLIMQTKGAVDAAMGGAEAARIAFNNSGEGSGPDWQRVSENTSGYSLKQLGAMSNYSMALAVTDGVSAYQNFATDQRQAMTQLGLSSGLTPAQAAVFADGFSTSDKRHDDALLSEVKSHYGDTPKAQEVYKDLHTILSSAHESNLHPQAYLSSVANYNNHVNTKKE